MGGERQPGIDCLRMHNHNLGIRLCLEIVGKINMYTSDIRLIYSRIIERYSCLPVELPLAP